MDSRIKSETKKTQIKGGTIIAFDGQEHRLLEDGVLVYEGNKIVYVGESYDDPVDETLDASGKLVIPGLISTHAHVSAQEGQRLIMDGGRRDFFHSGFLNYIPTKLKGGSSFFQSSDPVASIRFGIASLIRNGVTSVVPFDPGGADNGRTMAKLAGELGLRIFFAPVVAAGAYKFNDEGKVHLEWNEQAAMEGLERTAEFIEAHDNGYDGRVKGMVVLDEIYTSTEPVLRRAKELADELAVGLTLHCADHFWEFVETVRFKGKTPVEVLAAEGVLGPRVLLAHSLFVSGHSATAKAYPHGNDLEILATSGSSVAHCPLGLSRRGLALESFQKYLDLGINISLGTDVYPMDLFEEMRTAAIVCKLVDSNHESGRAVDVFNAATLGGAKALGRDDLGRLAPGAKADIVIVDFDNLRIGPVSDCLRALVHLATPDMVDTVIVNGQMLVANKNILTCNEQEVLASARRLSKDVWSSFSEYHWEGKTIDEEFPPSLKRWGK